MYTKLIHVSYTNHIRQFKDTHAFEPRITSHYEFAYIISDQGCRLSLDGIDYDIRGEAVVFRKPGQSNQSFMPYESFYVQFEMDDEVKEAFIDEIDTVTASSSKFDFRKTFELIYREVLMESKNSEYLASAKILEILYQLSKSKTSIIDHASEGVANETMLMILKYIDDHISRSLTISELSKAASVSERQIHYLFDRYIEMTPNRYISRCRMNHAMSLLKRTQMPVKAIATFCGYSNVNYFHQSFKKHAGLTATQYRVGRG